jgi:4-hydroxythreonine-4-phosphate dehydrogenase
MVRNVSDLNRIHYEYKTLNIYNVPINYELKPGYLQAGNGKASLDYINKSVELINFNFIDAISTAPINKEAIKMAGSKFTGVTELLAGLANVKNTSTIVKQGECYIFQLTTHLPLKDAINKINDEFLYNQIKKAYTDLKLLGLTKPKIGLSGLNPHAGEGGVLGREEKDYFLPVVNRLRNEGIDISDPIPADTIFIKGYKGEYNAIIAMYHDAANIAIKLMARQMDTIVITGGLPFVRTTVAHGTAYDIAYKGIADYEQMKQAILGAANITIKKLEQTGEY